MKKFIKNKIHIFNMILIFTFCYFLFNNNVFALSTSEYIRNPLNNPIIEISGTSTSVSITNSNGSSYTYGVFDGYGEGVVNFSFAMFNDTLSVPIYEVYLTEYSTFNSYLCTTGNYNTYYDNTTQITIVSASCPVNLVTNRGISGIAFKRVSNVGTEKILVSDIASFISKDSTEVNVNVNQAAVIANAIDNNNLLISKIQQSNQAVIDSAHQDAIQAHQDSQDIKDSITSDTTTGAESSAESFVDNSAFDDNTGLSAIISMPLTFVNTLSSACSPISLTIPYMDYQFQLPCIQSIVNNYAPALVVIIKVIVNGLIIYWVMLDIFKIVKNAKNPDDDRIEVLDL